MAGRAKIPDKAYSKYNQPRCKRVSFSSESLDKLQSQYRDIRGQPVFMDDFLHLKPESEAVRIFSEFPDLLKWADDGSFLIKPNLPYENSNTLSTFSKKGSKDRLALIAWYVHPKQLEETVFANADCRENFSAALKRVNYVPALEPKKSIQRNLNQKRIKELEDESGIPYFASVLDLTPTDIPWLKKLKQTTIKCLATQYRIQDDDQVALYFHIILPEETATLHLHIRINQGLHPADEDKSITLDCIIDALEHGKSVKDFLLEKGCQYKYSTASSKLIENSGMQITEVDNPFVIESPWVSFSKGKTFKEYKDDCIVDGWHKSDANPKNATPSLLPNDFADRSSFALIARGRGNTTQFSQHK